MIGPLAKYVARSPRYILQPDDNTLVRIAGPHQIPWEEGTEIQNVSLSGLAFTAPADLSPLIGEIIKLQFEVPGKSQMACFALVSRIDRHGQSNIVGVKFMKMEFSQRVFLAQSLSKKLREQQMATWNSKSLLTKQSVWIAVWFLLSAWLVVNWLWMSGSWRKLIFE